MVEEAVRARDKFIASLSLIDLKALGSRRLLLLEGMGQGYERAVGLHLAACDAELRRVRACATAASAPGQTPEHASVA